jgi:ferredoxin
VPFIKTEVDIKTDYAVAPVEAGWLQEGVKSPKHLMLDPEPCILCRACEDVCPWNAIWMMSPDIVQETPDGSVGSEIRESYALFVVDDNACTRCSVCVERCPSDCLYYARLPEDTGGARPLAAVPESQRADADAE